MTNIPAESVLDVDMGIMARERLSNEWGSPAIPASEAGSVDYPQSFMSGLSVPSVAPVGSTRSWSSKPRDSMEELKGMMENILKIMDKKERRKAMNITQSRSPRSIKSAQQSKPSWKKTLRSNASAISERSAPRDLKINLKVIKEDKPVTPHTPGLLSQRWKKNPAVLATSPRSKPQDWSKVSSKPRGINAASGRKRTF